MARAAVRAKQAERAKAEAAKPRGKRKHASGGNPNQNLFFTRLRRRQRWVFLMLAVLFAISFAALGVGSGTGGLEQVFNGILGSGSDAVSQAQNEIKTDPKKGYLDLANAYQTNSDYTDAITALQNYLKIDKTNAAEWSQLGLIQARQASSLVTQYQAVQRSTSLEAPGTMFEPTGALANKLGTNLIDQYFEDQNQTQLSTLATQVSNGYDDSLISYKKAAKYSPRGLRANAEYALAQAAENAGNTSDALKAYQAYVQVDPTSPLLAQIEARCVQLKGSCTPAKHKK